MANASFVKHTTEQVLRSKEYQIVLNFFNHIKSKKIERKILVDLLGKLL
jgi:hypothetical protein